MLYLLEIMNEGREDTNLGTFRLVIKQPQDGCQPVPPLGASLQESLGVARRSFSGLSDACPPRPRGENFCLTPYLGDTTVSPTGGGGRGEGIVDPCNPTPPSAGPHAVDGED